MKIPIPAFDWLRSYEKSWLRGDAVAGITLAAYLLPAGLGDASLANLPPEAGLYACLFGGLVFWLFCSSRHTAITVTSAISLLVGASLGEIAGGDTTRFGALAAGTALLVALIAFVAWLAKAGSIVNFISESVMVGFKCGVALFLASTQLPKLFGIHGAHGNFWENSGHFLKHLGETNPTSLAVGGTALGVLVLGKLFLKNKPVALFVVLGGIAASSWLGLEGRGVKLLGEVPQGLPALGLPAIHWADLNELLPLAIACFLLGAVETAAIGRMFTAKHGGRLDANQEFLALAASNLAAGLGRGFPISGGMSQSLVNEGGGAHTPLSGAFAAGIILVVVLFFSHLLAALPQPVLAAVVLVAVTGLFKISTLKQLRHTNKTEYVVAVGALVGVLSSGLLRGVMIGAIISLVLLIRRASRPHVAFLGRIPGTRRFSDHERHPDNELIPGILVFRPESGLLYFNMDHVRDTIAERVRAESTAPKLVVLDLSAAPHVDMHGAHMLAGLAGELTTAGVRVQVVEARSSVRERLRCEGVDEKLGSVNRFTSVADAVEAFQKQPPTKGPSMNALLKEIRHNPLLWLLAFVPVVFVAAKLKPEAHTLLFVLSVLAIVPLAALLSHATESVAAKTGDAVGGLLNATLGNLTELVIAITALRAGQYMLVKASIAGAIVTNTLFMLGASFLLGGLKHHVQEYNRVSARVQAGLLFLATIALLIPSAVTEADATTGAVFTHKLSVGLAVLLIVAYGLGMLFSLKTHRELFASAKSEEAGEAPWPMGLALATLAGVTVLVALVSEVFVESVQKAAEAFGMTPAFVGFIVVALVGGAAEMASAFSGARKNRLDLSVGIALGSASQIALFVAPVLVLLSYVLGPTPMDLQFWPGAVVMMLIATLTASLVTNSGRSAWFVGVLVLMVYLIFAMTLYLLPPRAQ